MTAKIPVDLKRAFRIAGALVGLAAVLGACTHTDEAVTASVPDDYRLRHPIAIEETNRSVVIFVGHARGGLSASQRTDVMGLAQTWVREGTGAIVADVPVDTPNAPAAASSFREIQAVLAAGGVPPRGITLRHYHSGDPRKFAAISLRCTRICRVCRTLRPVAGGPRTLDQGPDLFREQGLLQFWLRLPAQHGGDDRQSVGPCAAAI